MWLPLVRLLLGTWPTTQACASTVNPTRDPLVRRLVLNPLSHTSQGNLYALSVSLISPHLGANLGNTPSFLLPISWYKTGHSFCNP